MFRLVWLETAAETYHELRRKAQASQQNRQKKGKGKSSQDEGLFKQVVKTVRLLRENPRHPGLRTHEYDALEHPYSPKAKKVFEAYVQHRTPGAYRLFWCYGPNKGEITILAITPHP